MGCDVAVGAPDDHQVGATARRQPAWRAKTHERLRAGRPRRRRARHPRPEERVLTTAAAGTGMRDRSESGARSRGDSALPSAARTPSAAEWHLARRMCAGLGPRLDGCGVSAGTIEVGRGPRARARGGLGAQGADQDERRAERAPGRERERGHGQDVAAKLRDVAQRPLPPRRAASAGVCVRRSPARAPAESVCRSRVAERDGRRRRGPAGARAGPAGVGPTGRRTGGPAGERRGCAAPGGARPCAAAR